MPSLRREIMLKVNPEKVWAAILDLGALPKLTPGVVLTAEMEDDMRLVTYADGLQLREWVVDLDPIARRLVMTSVGGKIKHLNSSIQVFAEGRNRSRVEWICDFLPAEIGPSVHDIIDREIAAAKQVLERGERPDGVGP